MSAGTGLREMDRTPTQHDLKDPEVRLRLIHRERGKSL
jgi:hypothetical protein